MIAAAQVVPFGPEHTVAFEGKENVVGLLASELEPANSPAKPQPKAAPRKSTSKVEVLYQHPENAELCWTGRGRQPKWVEHWIKEGGTLEGLLAKKRPAHKPKGGKATSAACDIATQRCDKTMELPGVTTNTPPSA